jgi:hypothetical protein
MPAKMQLTAISTFGTFSLFLLFMGSSFGQTATMTLASGSGTPGTLVSLPLSLSTSTGGAPAALQWTLSYSTSDFTGVNLTPGASAASAGKTLDCANIAPGRQICTLFGLNNGTMGGGTIATATFAISGATTNSSSFIQVTGPIASSATGWPITATTSGSTLTIIQPAASGLTCNPTTVQGPATTTCTVAISRSAPAGGTFVALGYISTGGVAASMQSSVTVPAGSTSVSFPVQIGSASAVSSVTISGSAGGVTQTATVQVNPASAQLSISVSPQSVSLTANRSQQFAATVSGSSNTNVTWSISPQAGTISTAGLYVAPGTISAQNTVTVTATTVATPIKAATAQVTLLPDTTTPVISGISISPQSTSAVIAWQTNEPANTTVMYGWSSWYLSRSVSLTEMVTSHTVSLSGLWSNRTYYYRLVSTDVAGNTAVVPPATSPPASFQTIDASASARPVIGVGTTATWIRWHTDDETAATVTYGTTPNALTKTASHANRVQSHKIMLNGLRARSTYYYRLTWTDSSGARTTWPPPSSPPESFTQETTVSLWNTDITPDVITAGNKKPIEVGVRFQSDVDATVIGVRFFKGPENTGVHVGHLWTSSGAPLGSATFSNESAWGWQSARFSRPIPIRADTEYVVSYYAPTGKYSVSEDYFDRMIYSASLNSPFSTKEAGNGLYNSKSSGFPRESKKASNYWVDVIVE